MFSLCRASIVATIAATLATFAFAETPASRPFTFSFHDADVDDFAVLLVRALTDKQPIIHKEVRGKISLVTTSPLPREAAYALFVESLDKKGFSVSENETSVTVAPRQR